ncbi:MAG TPA: CAP domain-containing protein [Trebonia sp.]
MDRGTRMAAVSAHRVRFLLSGVLALAVLAGGSLYLARSGFFPASASSRATGSPKATAAGCGAEAAGLCAENPPGLAVAAPPALARVPSASSRLPSPHHAAPATGTAGARPSASAAAPGGPPATQGGTPAAQVLALINQARSAAGLPALTISSGLQASSSAHNMRMAGGCGLSHQCPGEPALGDRETAAGVHWTAAGENIGDGGPVADTDAAIAQMAVGLTQSMLNEQPPDDGHRLNILSSTFTHIGIAVYRDSSGTVWLTQDFSD